LIEVIRHPNLSFGAAGLASLRLLRNRRLWNCHQFDNRLVVPFEDNLVAVQRGVDEVAQVRLSLLDINLLHLVKLHPDLGARSRRCSKPPGRFSNRTIPETLTVQVSAPSASNWAISSASMPRISRRTWSL